MSLFVFEINHCLKLNLKCNISRILLYMTFIYVCIFQPLLLSLVTAHLFQSCVNLTQLINKLKY